MLLSYLPVLKPRYFVALVGIVALGGLVMPATSSASGSGSKKEDPLNWVPPTHVQMVPMMIPAGRTTVPITFILEAVKREQTEGICKRMPLVRDAILTVLSREPIPVQGRKIVLEGVGNRIVPPINEAVGHHFVKKIYITPGAVKMGDGKVSHKPYAVISGCDNILRSEKARDQALKAAQGH